MTTEPKSIDQQFTDFRRRHVSMMRRTVEIIGHVLKSVTVEQATTLRDGPEGWTILEVLCHLRDFDGFFYGRAIMMLEEEYPSLPAYDHEVLAIDRGYNRQDIKKVYDELVLSRQRFIEFFKGLTEEQWSRAGVHPERGHFTMTDAAIQVGTHDVTHIEQITRILADSLP